jgi:hypothetical protein
MIINPNKQEALPPSMIGGKTATSDAPSPSTTYVRLREGREEWRR